MTDFLGLHRLFELEYATVNLHDIVLGSYAVALLALSQRSETFCDSNNQKTVEDTLITFQEYVSEKGDGICFTGRVAKNDAHRRLIITPLAMSSIAESLRKLSSQNAIRSRCEEIMRTLRDVCYSEPAFKKALDTLDAAQDSPCTVQPGPGPALSEARSFPFATASSRASTDMETLHPKEGSEASGRPHST